MSHSYSIVPATRQHLPMVPVIEQAAASLFSEHDLPADIRFLVTEPDLLCEAQKDGRMWMALQTDGQPVGFAYAVFIDGQAHLDEMNVHPEHGRRGVGTRLLRTVIEWSRAVGSSGLTLITFRHLPWNAPFYERLGFRCLAQDNVGQGLRSLISEEALAGIDTTNRVAMRIAF